MKVWVGRASNSVQICKSWTNVRLPLRNEILGIYTIQGFHVQQGEGQGEDGGGGSVSRTVAV